MFSDSQLTNRMSIGAIGWWNYDNQGDLAMLSALRQGLAPHRVVAIDTGFPAHADTISRLNRLDYVLLGGGTLIPGRPTAPFDTFDQWADQLEVPLGVIGMGVDPFLEQYWPAIAALLDRAEFFFVRDQASRTLLRDHPKVQVAPDLTFVYPLPVREKCPGDATAAPICGVNLRRSRSFDPVPWLDALGRLPAELKGIPLSSFHVFDESVLLRQLDPESPQRFDAALYRQLDLMIGTAFHSILFSVQATVPVIAIDYAPKVCNFMEDVGLARYVLAPDEHDKLSGLVAEVLANRSTIASDLRAIRTKLHQEAQQSMGSVRAQIEQRGPRHRRTGPKVTIAVVGSGSAEKDERTLGSCASQTYENAEVLLVGADWQASAAARLRETIASASGEYLTWVDGGDWCADDALDCLVDRLEQEHQWDVVYADYYAINESNLPLGYHTVPGPEKLFRRDVVGPCFLLRKTLLARMTLPPPDSPLVAYGLWLQASSSSTLAPFHAPLFYSARPARSRAVVKQEREVRRRWRQSRSVWSRALWSVIDTDLGERVLVQPFARLRDLLRRRSSAERH
jgi:hypothetical protein